ncbi:isocitrate lyase/phosphoenolpyruvate mutase family protein [Phytomonospora sp. NPDC050363]|uniref:isocitrate lyase/PEP mutase family protein n=1 Tax=Phytomonospora sp. NPDC050363 TaxID=3155642 RepID=UPI0033C00AC2
MTTFRDLHVPGRPLLLANAWDAASARIIADAGAPAIATTSAGVAWSLGVPDGDALDRDTAIALIARVVAAVDVPVTADIEGGFAHDAAGVGETLRLVAETGAAGVNLEDAGHGTGRPLLPVEEFAERLAAAAESGVFVNARIDTYLRGVGDPAGRLDATLERAAAYVAAGADGIFVPGVVDVETATILAKGIDAPVNLLIGPGAPSVAELAATGVARLSLGSGVAQAAYAVARRAARELLESGTYESVADAVDYGELNRALG